MSFFDEDPFEEIMREFFGERKPRTSSARGVVRGESEERVIDYIEEEDYVYFVFELNGYLKKDIVVEINKGELLVKSKQKNLGGVQSYLSERLNKGVYFKKSIPKNVNVKKFDWTFQNGILEVRFGKK